jgi:Tfp pilus assembly protein PilX
MRRPTFQTQAVLRREDGIAMLTMLMLTVILTVIGIAAITTTTMDMKSAGGEALRETSTNTAEACLGIGAQIIQHTLTNSAVPASLLVPSPILTINPIPLQDEILGVDTFVQFTDTADPQNAAPTPNAILDIAGFDVNMDIDRLFMRAKAGGNLNAHEGNSGSVPTVEVLYRINCFSSGGLGTVGHVTGVYACSLNKGICQRQIT